MFDGAVVVLHPHLCRVSTYESVGVSVRMTTSVSEWVGPRVSDAWVLECLNVWAYGVYVYGYINT